MLRVNRVIIKKFAFGWIRKLFLVPQDYVEQKDKDDDL